MTRKFTESRILIATHNAGKLDEMRQLFAPHGVEVIGAAEMNLPEPEETEATFVGNARIKAHAAAKATGMPALADDSGIEVEALDNAPGVYTADWAETENGRDFIMAMTKTRDLLEEKNAPHPRSQHGVNPDRPAPLPEFDRAVQTFVVDQRQRTDAQFLRPVDERGRRRGSPKKAVPASYADHFVSDGVRRM